MFSIRWEIGLCNSEQYEKFLKQLKTEFPNDWKDFEFALKKDYITLDYIYKFIGNKKVYLWGASNFLKNILESERDVNPYILGVIDKNEASWGKDFCGYKIFSPEILKQNPANILVTVYNNPNAYFAIKKEVEEEYTTCKILENIFGRE